MARAPEVVAAGAVVTRRGGREVLLVHRPEYDDWSFPKGKRDPGEHITTTAVREVREETGLRIALGRPLAVQAYLVSKRRTKVVHYWAARSRGADDVSSYQPNREIDDVRWVGLEEARRMLSYLDDIDVLEDFARHPRRTRALVVVRHAGAVPRKQWDGPDPLRPLAPAGRAHAKALRPVLAAYHVRAVTSSPSVRCLDTVAPFLEHHASLVTEPALSEEDADERTIRDILDRLLATPANTAVCTHRPVLPLLLAALGLAEERLATGELLVCHHRRGRIRAIERHRP